MASIALLSLDSKMLDLARRKLAGRHDDVLLVKGRVQDAVGVARRLMSEGVEVVISRGATARLLARELPDLSVVDISTASLAMMAAIHKARAKSRQVAVVEFQPMASVADEIGRMLGVNVVVHELDTEDDIEPAVERACREGCGVVVGGYLVAEVARRLNIACQPVEIVPQGLVASVEEAKRIVRAREVERAKSQMLRAVLATTDNGILAVDRRGCVTLINPHAARVLRVNEADAIGRPVGEFWPSLGLEHVIANGVGEVDRVEHLPERDVVCDTIPIGASGEIAGALVTFHDVREIQRMEASVRKRAQASGLVATARFDDLLGESPALLEVIERARNYARTPATVLILGETGTGKELFAQGIHNASPRHAGPFVALNCAALPGQLLESELFGYVQGAFTGASQKGKTGLVELAHGGTLFLDEIAEMDRGTQGKLLRVLAERQVMRLGSDQVIPVDVRIVAATNRQLRRLVDEGAFRDDLYYRLNVLQLQIPPLRDRASDIGLLAAALLRRACAGGAFPTLTRGALRELEQHPWPGNVRELQNVMTRVAATRTSGSVSASLVRELLDDGAANSPLSPPLGEASRIAEALAQTGGRVAEAARLLGISRATLWRRTKKPRRGERRG